jgi:hypothetical protein
MSDAESACEAGLQRMQAQHAKHVKALEDLGGTSRDPSGQAKSTVSHLEQRDPAHAHQYRTAGDLPKSRKHLRGLLHLPVPTLSAQKLQYAKLDLDFVDSSLIQ